MTPTELDAALKQQLDFPDVCGMNWDAFRGSITDLVEIPDSTTMTRPIRLPGVQADATQGSKSDDEQGVGAFASAAGAALELV